MTDYTAADVKALRERTGAGMLDCRNALAEANGDVEKAIEILRIRGQKGVEKRSGRATTAGLVAAACPEEGSVGKLDATLIELASETDFVAKTDRFMALAHTVLGGVAIGEDVYAKNSATQGWIRNAAAQLGEKIELRQVKRVKGEKFAVYLHRTSKDLPPQVGVIVGYQGEDEEVARHIAQHIAFAEPQYLSVDVVPAEAIAKERELFEAAAREQGKPEAALRKIVESQLSGFFKRVVLLEQPFERDNKQTIKQVAAGVGIEVQGFARIKVGQ